MLQNVCDGVTQLRGGSEGEVDDAEGNTEALRSHFTHELSGAGDLEGGFLDLFGYLIEGGSLQGTEGAIDHTGSGYADGNDAVRLLDAVEGAGHEGVIADGVGEDHELGAADGATVLGKLGCLLDDSSHLRGRIHVDAGAGGGDVDRGTHQVRLCQGFRDGTDECLFGGGSALFNERRVATNEVDASGGCRTVQRAGDVHGVSVDAGHDERDRGHGDALVDDRDAELGLDSLAHLNQLRGAGGHEVIDGFSRGFHGGSRAAEERNAHGHGADIETVFLDHLDGVENTDSIEAIKHDSLSFLDLIHGGEQRFRLHANGLLGRFTHGVHSVLNFADAHLILVEFNPQDHGEKARHKSLRNIHDVDVELSKGSRHGRDDAGAIGTGDSHDGNHDLIVSCVF